MGNELRELFGDKWVFAYKSDQRCQKCGAEAEYLLLDENYRPQPAGWYCEYCGKGIVAEFLTEFGEVWTLFPLRPLDSQGRVT